MHQTDEEEEDEDLDEALDDRNPRSQRKGEKGRTDDEGDYENILINESVACTGYHCSSISMLHPLIISHCYNLS